jgi:hypothetical protein
MIKINEYDDVKFKKAITDKFNIEGVSCIDNERKVITGNAQICIMEGSYKFPKQIQFAIFSHKTQKIKTEKRNSSEWNLLEIDIPFEEGLKLINEFNEMVKSDKLC